LTKEELIEAHGRCGNVLHARNPFGKVVDYDEFLRRVIDWTNRVLTLLNCHEVWLICDEHFHVVHMKEHDHDEVRMYTFDRVQLT
jgi:aspartate/methionine/tyrosine aminotransferase